MSCAITVGLIVSSTITVAVSDATLPLTSVTYKITVFEPTLEQLKLELLRVYDAISQLSVEPLLIIAGTILACPFASNWIVIFCVRTVGFIISSMFTVNVSVTDNPS